MRSHIDLPRSMPAPLPPRSSERICRPSSQIFVPPNCRFEVDDAEDEWIFNQSFDYIHLRLVFHGFKSHFGRHEVRAR